ncbi:DedA family protein [Arthrobacter sp. S39]|uniref:DedA family protein n=1 Tax=Arthrobacter sp. S39 TaxID=2509720 RepID=UPI001037C115|nr:DedA family protein [Arthrobacter sp. S39]TAP40102.1 DedA family protein [Arthrobacter sp. S39]
MTAALAAPLSTASAIPSAANPAAADLSGVSEWVVGVMEAVGAPGAGLVVALENLFPPIPSEVILPLAGFTASRGGFSLLDAILWTTAGSLLGAYVLYLLGRWLGRDRTRALIGRIPLVAVADVDRVEAWFARHGSKAVFLGRLVPLFRSLVSIPAGIDRMPLWRFLGLTLAGSLIWNSVLILAGYFLGENWPRVEEYAGVLQLLVIVAVAGLVVLFVAKKLRKRRERVTV